MEFPFLLFIFLSFVRSEPHTFRIFHTNDVHGWVNGHRKIPELNATYADYKNLLVHLNSSVNESTTILGFDSGDLTQGTGLSDATPIPGTFILETALALDLDALVIGNHELYENRVIDWLAENVGAKTDRYLGMNVKHKDTSKTLTHPYRLIPFGNAQGKNHVLVIGLLFNFAGADSQATVTDVEDTVKQDEIKRIVAENNVKLIVLLLHSPPEEDETLWVKKQMVDITKGTIPIVTLCGHDHIVFKTEETDAQATIESECYFQKLGEVQITIELDGSSTNVGAMDHKDNVDLLSTHSIPLSSSAFLIPSSTVNSFSLLHHTTSIPSFMSLAGKIESDWETEQGLALRSRIKEKEEELELSKPVGCSPHTYLGVFKMEETRTNRSLYSFYVNEIMPKMDPLANFLKERNENNGESEQRKNWRSNEVSERLHHFPNTSISSLSSHASRVSNKASLPTKVYSTNSASLRSHLFEGEVYRDEVFSIEPFSNTFCAIEKVGLDEMRALLDWEGELDGVGRNDGHQETAKEAFGGEQAWNDITGVSECLPASLLSSVKARLARLCVEQLAGGEKEREQERRRVIRQAERQVRKCEQERGIERAANASPLRPLLSNRIVKFNDTFKLTSFTLPPKGKESPKEKAHLFTIVTNSYDAPRLTSVLNRIAEEMGQPVSSPKFSFVCSTIATRTVFEQYLRLHMKCNRPKAGVVWAVAGSITGVTILVVIVLVVVVVTRRKREDEKRWKTTAVNELFNEPDVKYQQLGNSVR
ncbi:putative 5' nucleotidase family protein [Blattamonas nauphoetae]|uniref:5' nucleotidase family protein n=1 Tax=Blattamonas nauphoetae TaxID=2049346 RepID=A0ABQ9WVM7_9EUKA|nr:putative 5' nucleotidase family protein [Blattamonas nauphoetae]